MPSGAFKIAMTFTAVDATAGVFRMLENRFKNMGEAGKKMQKDFDSMISHMQTGIKSLVAAWELGKMFSPFEKAAANMQEAMLEMKMTLQTAGKAAAQLNEELEKVRETADKLQKRTPFSAKDIVEAETVFKKAGINIEDITAPKGAAYASASLGTIAHMPPSAVAQDMTKIAKAFDLKGDEYGKLSDILQRTITSTTLDLPGLSSGLSNFAGEAHALGLGLEGSVQALATVSESVRDPSAAGTYLKNLILRITAPTKKGQQSLEDAGFNFWTGKGKLKDWDAIVAELKAKTAGLSEKELMPILKDFGEMRGLEAILPLIAPGRYEAVGAKSRASADQETKMDTRLEGLIASVQTLSTTIETAMGNIGNPVLGPLKQLADVANEAADGIAKFAAGHQQAFGYAEAGGAAALGGLGLYGMYRIGRGLQAGGRVLRGLRNFGGMGVGIAEGKAIQAATGVTPVFVVNWPGGGIGGENLKKDANAVKEIVKDAAPVVASTLGTWMAGSAFVGMLGMALYADPHGTMLGETHYVGEDLGRMGEKYSAESGLANFPFGEQLSVTDANTDQAIQQLIGTVKEGQKNNITLNISVDQSGRVTSSSNDSNTTSTINLKRGEFDFAGY
jgi:TP901 family phage tail tape measure protein